MKTSHLFVVAALAFAVAAMPASAASIYWNGSAGDGNWSTPGNWTGGVVPGTADLVMIDSSKFTTDQTINISSDVTVTRIYVQGATARNVTIGGTGNLVLQQHRLPPKHRYSERSV